MGACLYECGYGKIHTEKYVFHESLLFISVESYLFQIHGVIAFKMQTLGPCVVGHDGCPCHILDRQAFQKDTMIHGIESLREIWKDQEGCTSPVNSLPKVIQQSYQGSFSPRIQSEAPLKYVQLIGFLQKTLELWATVHPSSNGSKYIYFFHQWPYSCFFFRTWDTWPSNTSHSLLQ